MGNVCFDDRLDYRGTGLGDGFGSAVSCPADVTLWQGANSLGVYRACRGILPAGPLDDEYASLRLIKRLNGSRVRLRTAAVHDDDVQCFPEAPNRRGSRAANGFEPPVPNGGSVVFWLSGRVDGNGRDFLCKRGVPNRGCFSDNRHIKKAAGCLRQ